MLDVSRCQLFVFHAGVMYETICSMRTVSRGMKGLSRVSTTPTFSQKAHDSIFCPTSNPRNSHSSSEVPPWHRCWSSLYESAFVNLCLERHRREINLIVPYSRLPWQRPMSSAQPASQPPLMKPRADILAAEPSHARRFLYPQTSLQ